MALASNMKKPIFSNRILRPLLNIFLTLEVSAEDSEDVNTFYIRIEMAGWAILIII